MVGLTASSGLAPSRTGHGIACVQIGMVFFVMQDAMMKSLLATYPVWTLLFARSVVAVLVLTPLIRALGGAHRLVTPLWPLHLARAVLFAVGFSMFFAAFPFMGLAEASTIFFAAPLITALLAALILGESIGPHRSGALLVGFFGILIAMNPTGAGFSWAAILPLGAAVTYALSQIIARQIGDRESTLTVGLYTLGFAGVLVLPMGWLVGHLVPLTTETRHLRWEMSALPLPDLAELALLGVMGMVGYMLLSRAYQIANASLVAPFDYTYLPLATVLAYVVWSEVPGPEVLIGMTMIVASGLYLGWREVRAARHGAGTPVTAETVFAPGLPVQPPHEDVAS